MAAQYRADPLQKSDKGQTAAGLAANPQIAALFIEVIKARV